jgi:hypothetical protein
MYITYIHHRLPIKDFRTVIGLLGMFVDMISIIGGLPPGIVVTARGSQAQDRGFDPRWELQNLYDK